MKPLGEVELRGAEGMGWDAGKMSIQTLQEQEELEQKKEQNQPEEYCALGSLAPRGHGGGTAPRLGGGPGAPTCSPWQQHELLPLTLGSGWVPQPSSPSGTSAHKSYPSRLSFSL